MKTDAYMALMGAAPKRIPHWENLSNPAFVKYVTGIDPWEKPRSAALTLHELYPIDVGRSIPADDTPIPKIDEGVGTVTDENGRAQAVWGAGTTGHWEWGRDFRTIEDVLSYDPLEHLDMTKVEVVENLDYSLDDDAFYKTYFSWGDGIDNGDRDIDGPGFYNTLFMWPLLTFGWELFLELVGGYPEEARRIIDGFAHLSRKAFTACAKMPERITAVIFHDDICMTAGPVCSPSWLRDYIFPYYEEFFSIVKAGGKKAIFISDGNVDNVIDDVVTCGADGYSGEPYTNFKRIAAKYPHLLLAGEGDNRILMRGDGNGIRAMVDSMVETAGICGGYMMGVGNHIPWNIPAENVKLYFDYCKERAHR